VIGAVNRAGKELTPAQVSADVGSIDSKRAATYLARAVQAGRIRRTSRGKYAPNTRVESMESVEFSFDH
jgi:hypothetical protein